MEKILISKKFKDEKMFKILSLIFGLSFILLGIKDKEIIKLLLGILLAILSIYNKEVYVSEEGIVYTYKVLRFKRFEYIDFKDLDEITIVKQKGNCIAFFVKEPMAKKLVLNEEKLDEMVEFIKAKSKVPLRFESHT